MPRKFIGAFFELRQLLIIIIRLCKFEWQYYPRSNWAYWLFPISYISNRVNNSFSEIKKYHSHCWCSS